MPFGRSYKWCPESVTIECDGGERLIFKASAAFTSSVVLCECGEDYTADIQEECQRHQPEVLGQTLEAYETAHHPWLHDTKTRQNNTNETRLLILKTPSGATMTSRCVVRMTTETCNSSL